MSPGASLALVTLLVGCTSAPPVPAAGAAEAWAVNGIENEAISESSGLVRSRTHPGVFWTHNDSGDSARIFAIDAAGRSLGEFAVEGAEHVDWEDIAVDDEGHLYIADFGNNANQRRDLVIYRVPEPDPAADSGRVRVDRALRFRYADQRAYGRDGPMNYDAEAAFWHGGALYIFTKHRSDTRTRMYRLPTEGGGDGERALEPVLELDLGGEASERLGNTTAADISADGRFVALLTYRALYLYEAGSPLPTPRGVIARIPFVTRHTRQAESVAWDDGALIIGNEQRQLFRIPDPLAPSLHRYPPGDVAE